MLIDRFSDAMENSAKETNDYYFVLYAPNDYNKSLYNSRKRFDSLQAAREFLSHNLHKNPVLIRQAYKMDDFEIRNGEELRNEDTPYAVVEQLRPSDRHVLRRTSRRNLEETIINVAKHNPLKIYAGVELKLNPSIEIILKAYSDKR